MTKQTAFAYQYRLKTTDTESPFNFQIYDAAMLSPGIPVITGFQADMAFNKAGTRVFESGVISYGKDNTLSFDTVDMGCVDTASEIKQGMIMWHITGGTGFFAGVTGNITSNFLDFPDGTSMDHHFAVVFFPD